jgi:glutamine synthetase
MLSLWDEAGRNLFRRDEHEAFGLSKVMGQSIAGLLDFLPSLSLLLNPNLNSYKRLIPGFFAPVNATWGIGNRTVAVRAVESPSGEGTKAGTSTSWC